MIAEDEWVLRLFFVFFSAQCKYCVSGLTRKLEGCCYSREDVLQIKILHGYAPLGWCWCCYRGAKWSMCFDVCIAFEKDKCIGEVLKGCSILLLLQNLTLWLACDTIRYRNCVCLKELLSTSALSQISTDCRSRISKLRSVCLLLLGYVLPLCKSRFLLYCLATSHLHRVNLRCQSVFYSMWVFSTPFAHVDLALG